MAAITLTFDNGPHPETTPRVLDILARHNVKATFFMVGVQLATPEGRALAERVRAEGHWIGNHTWSHSIPLGERDDEAEAWGEVSRTQDALGELAHPDKLFRPFGGGGNMDRRLLSEGVLAKLIEQGYSCVLWSAVPKDWLDPEGWSETATEMCATQPWSVVLLHDHLTNGATDHLEAFIERCRDAGHEFRQELPDDCVPLRAGRREGPIRPYVA